MQARIYVYGYLKKVVPLEFRQSPYMLEFESPIAVYKILTDTLNHFKKFVFKGKLGKGVFPVEYIIKDLNLALRTAESEHVPQYFGALALQAYESAVAAGYGDRYYPVVVKVLENLTGVEVRADLEA
jgi:hypothetical protein